jgi:2-keto-3-deoxy-6-phosphogluconate aldolase
VLRTATSEACPKAMQAAIDGGFKIVEFTLTTPGCLDHLADFRKKYDGDVMVGCGTILTVEDAEKAMDAGGKLIRNIINVYMSLGEWTCLCEARSVHRF